MYGDSAATGRKFTVCFWIVCTCLLACALYVTP